MSQDLLFEIGTEELPSGSVKPLADALADNVLSQLKQAGIQHGLVNRYATPRRLAVMIADVDENQPDQTVSRRGPAVQASYNEQGEPSKALIGFAKSCGVEIDKLSTLKTDKGEYWMYETLKPGLQTKALLPKIIHAAVDNLPIARPMRWGNHSYEFARPVHWAVLLFGSDVVSSNILGVQTERNSYGHRFQHPGAVELSKPSEYESKLEQAYVLADFEKRRQQIIQQIKAVTNEQNMQAIMPEALVDEVTSIVEWPQALMADFDPAFLEVPSEALIASMQSHQKCFALQDNNGKLLPHFITISNIDSRVPKDVVSGNEKVMHARLSDASFFYQQDKKRALSDYQAAAAKVVFQARLGTLQDKTLRLQTLMAHLVTPLQLDEKQARRAAELSKCDLMTGMVGEFPELQGLMGYYYALNDGEDKAVAIALNEQYMPRFAADRLPETNLGTAISLADRLDTLVGIFAIGQKPTGMKDPFKLRRHALAVVRMLIANPAKLNLSTLITETLHAYGERLPQNEQAIADLHPFIIERMQSYYQSRGVTSGTIQAVRARQDDWLYDVDCRIKALQGFVQLPEAISLSSACKRVGNILQKSTAAEEHLEVQLALLNEAAEHALFDRVQEVENEIRSLFFQGDYATILKHLASLRDPIDAFFDHVLVMVDDVALQQNRLALLHRLQSLLQGVADISLLQLNHD